MKSVICSEKSCLDHGGNQQRSIAKCSQWWPLHAHACSRVCHWSTALLITLCGTDDIMATHHLRHCEMLQGKVSSQRFGLKYNCDL